ncbi:NAD dependent epimerase/dehydratase family domain-containing protein [Trichoderma breve]|uniref:NAD dependent epimerase/dehydratase family domain-containing protein n=1 Tax=Trichoderma breve TaxID=2034170 RepID=A0A9W9B696_9HYPO|nr:NAD dependent epimerase/dehydratase family domain-containing protein [Trichoderma breve]KAJ4854535.1 NAD dependent epimerase/dehydratase family domain-containing protein [Trichoderma breve]
MISPSKQTLLITGANGFLAGHVIKEALEQGYDVRGTVRSSESAKKVRDLFAEYAEIFSVFIIQDLTQKENYESAFVGVSKPITGVISVAAPFTLKVEDNCRQLLDPAIQGAIAMLDAVNLYGPSVQCVVTTLSFTAIIDLSKGCRPGHVYSEEDWNPMTYAEAANADAVSAYCASKALAENAIWDWMEREEHAFSVATINPPLIFGPYTGGITDLKHLNESTAVLWSLLDAKEVLPTDFAGFVDVRVAAKAHIEVYKRPDAGGQRFLVASTFNCHAAVDAVREDISELVNCIPEGTKGINISNTVYGVNRKSLIYYTNPIYYNYSKQTKIYNADQYVDLPLLKTKLAFVIYQQSQAHFRLFRYIPGP